MAALPPITHISTFESGWSDYGVADDPAGYYKDALGIVHLTGAIKGGTPPSYAFTLPAGYRGEGFFPSGSSDAAETSKGPCTLLVYLTGSVYVDSGCASAETGLDGITFRSLG